MSNTYTEVCHIAKWFWKRALLVFCLLTGFSLYFIYDWKVGYPKKNYHRAQFETFEKARDYFISHHEQGGTKEGWARFASGQSVQYYKQRDAVSYEQRLSTWPEELQDYDTYKSAYDSQSDQPAMWEQFHQKQLAVTNRLKAQSTESKEGRVAFSKATRWDEDLPAGITKKDYEANYRLIMYRTFEQAQELFESYQKEGKSAADWNLLASNHDIAFTEDRSIVPTSKQDEKWPAILSDYDRYYELAKGDLESGVEVNDPYLWKEYTSENKMGQKPKSDFYQRKQVDEQLYIAIGCLVVAGLIPLLALFMKKRFMAVDENAYYAPNGKKVLYTDMFRLDKRKWDTKALATISYKEGEGTEKVKIDGFVYGGVDKAEGEPAQKLFDVIMANFKGELIEFSDAEEDTES